MLGGCTRCEKGTLTSFFEQKLKLCADCAAVLVDKGKLHEEQAPKLRQDLQEARDFINSMVESYESEKLGADAARKGFSEDQNPFPQGNEKHAGWNFGWTRGMQDRRTAEAAAVIEWTVLNLDVIEQLAAGYGQKEIADKLEIISSKLSEFVEVQ